MPSPKVVIEQLTVIIATRNHSPVIMNAEFLKCSGIVSIDWELAQTPVCTNRLSQVAFSNGIELTAQPDRLIFSEVITGKPLEAVEVPAIARRYVGLLPNVEYLATGLNFKGYVAKDCESDTAHKYITSKLLSPGPWHEIGKEPARTAVNFVYTLERSLFNLTISEAVLRLKEDKTEPAVLFEGTFDYRITADDRTGRLQSLHQTLNSWQLDLSTYQDIVNQKFLAASVDRKVLIEAFTD
jgi:hypothetical protein